MYVSREVILSAAFWKLSATALRVYLVFLNKRVVKPVQGKAARRSAKGKYIDANDGQIQFTYREAREKYGISDGAFRTAIEQLVAVGLIDITHPGSGLHGDVTLFGLSERWRLYGTPEFVVKTRPKRKQFYGFTPGNRFGRNADKGKTQHGFSTVG